MWNADQRIFKVFARDGQELLGIITFNCPFVAEAMAVPVATRMPYRRDDFFGVAGNLEIITILLRRAYIIHSEDDVEHCVTLRGKNNLKHLRKYPKFEEEMYV